MDPVSSPFPADHEKIHFLNGPFFEVQVTGLPANKKICSPLLECVTRSVGDSICLTPALAPSSSIAAPWAPAGTARLALQERRARRPCAEFQKGARAPHYAIHVPARRARPQREDRR